MAVSGGARRAARAGFGAVALAALALAAAALTLAIPPSEALAHANLAEADPAPDSALDSAPETVTILFTEPIEDALSEIRVLDRNGRRADASDSAVDPENPLSMSVSLGELADGTYTVSWRNVSQVDGHSVRGAFAFSVGEPLSSDAGAGAALESDSPALQSPAAPAARWLALLGGMSLFGIAAFRLLVSAPVLGARGAPALSLALWRSDFRLMLAFAALFAVGSAAQLVIQASSAFDVSPISALGAPSWDILSGSSWGRLWIWRVALVAAAVAALIIAARRDGDKPAFALIMSAALGAAALLTVSLTSHAAATPNIRIEAMASDFAHLIAASAWTGGLLGLSFGLPILFRHIDGESRRSALAALVPRFSVFAGASVAILALTGAFGAWAQVTIPQAMATPYGAALGVKTAIVALILALAAANLIWVRPRLRGGDRAARILRRLVVAEAALIALAVLATGFLTTLEPARQVASRQGMGAADALTFSGEAEGAAISAAVEPGRLGANAIRVSARDPRGNPITNATDVRARLSYLDEDLGEVAVSMNQTGAGEFVLEDRAIGLAGAWQLEIVLQRPDSFDSRTAFRFELTGAEGGSLAIAPDARTGRILLASGLGLAALALLGFGLPLGGWRSRAGAAAMGAGTLAAALAAILAFAAIGGDDGAPERNPIAPTADSIAAGMALYAANCQSCHGETGAGDGPAAAALEPPPADLATHVPLHPDRALFAFIQDGVPDTAMAGVGDRLSDDEIWHVINYLQTLE